MKTAKDLAYPKKSQQSKKESAGNSAGKRNAYFTT